MNVYFISIDKLDKQVLKNCKNKNGIGNMICFFGDRQHRPVAKQVLGFLQTALDCSVFHFFYFFLTVTILLED